MNQRTTIKNMIIHTLSHQRPVRHLHCIGLNGEGAKTGSPAYAPYYFAYDPSPMQSDWASYDDDDCQKYSCPLSPWSRIWGPHLYQPDHIPSVIGSFCHSHRLLYCGFFFFFFFLFIYLFIFFFWVSSVVRVQAFSLLSSLILFPLCIGFFLLSCRC